MQKLLLFVFRGRHVPLLRNRRCADLVIIKFVRNTHRRIHEVNCASPHKKNIFVCCKRSVCRGRHLRRSFVKVKTLRFHGENNTKFNLAKEKIKGRTIAQPLRTILFSIMSIENRIKETKTQNILEFKVSVNTHKRTIGSSSPRSISIAQLNALLHLHLRPIKLIVYK